MAQKERTGKRDLSYSLWHRKPSMGRFVGEETAHRMFYYDIDGVESCFIKGRCYPLIFIETAYYTSRPDINKKPKASLGSAELTDSMCFVVLYKRSKTEVLKTELPGGGVMETPDIEEVFIKQFYPVEDKWTQQTPEEWAKNLLSLRKKQEKKLRARLGAPLGRPKKES